MNKIKALLVSVTVLLGLSACGDYDKTEDYLTNKEKVLLGGYYNKHSPAGYDITLRAVRLNRIVSEKGHYTKGYSPITATEPPFCDVINVIESEESVDRASVKRGTSVLSQWKLFKGESLRESCDKYNKVDTKPTETITQERSAVVPEKDKVIVNEKVLLSPDKYRELSVAAKDCKGAKVKLLMFLDSGELLTEDHYDTITKVVLQCEAFKLHTELNN